MTYAAGSTAAIAVAANKAERRVVQALRDAGAVSAETAAALKPNRLFERGALRRLMKRGAVRETRDLYWLDETAYAAFVQGRRGLARLIVGYAVGVALALAALAVWMRLT